MKKTIYLKARSLLRLLCAFLVLVSVVSGCSDDFDGYYDYPSDIDGALFEQISNIPEFSEFAKAIDKSPFIKRAIDKSGLYTVFAPTNAAVAAFFADPNRHDLFKPYSSIDDFDPSKSVDSMALASFLESHMMYDMYFEYTFNKAISNDKPNLELLAMGMSRENNRYQSRYKPADEREKDQADPLGTRYVWVRYENTRLRIWTKKYLDKYQINEQYKSIYGVQPGTFNVGASKVLENEMLNGEVVKRYRDIPAKNGCVHAIDKVLPLNENMDMVIKRVARNFWDFNQRYVYYDYDRDATERQYEKDSLFMKTYRMGADYAWEVNSYTFLLPDEDKFMAFVEEVKAKYDNDIDSVPSSYFGEALYAYRLMNEVDMTYIERTTGVLNYLADTLTTNSNPAGLGYLKIELDPSKKYIASNGFIYGVTDVILAPFLRTVVKAVYGGSEFKTALSVLAYSSSSAKSAMVQPANYYSFFLGRDNAYTNLGLRKHYSGSIADAANDGMTFTLKLDGKTPMTNQYDSLTNYARIQPYTDPVTEAVTKHTPEMFQRTGTWHIRTMTGNYWKVRNGNIVANDPFVFGRYIEIPIPANGSANVIETDNGYAYILPEMPNRPKHSITGFLKNIMHDSYIESDGIYSKKFKHLLGLMTESTHWYYGADGDYKNKNDQTKLGEDLDKFSGTMYTFFAPTDQAIEDYAAANGLLSEIQSGNYSNENVRKLFGPALRNLIVSTSVFSTGERTQIGNNPIQEDPEPFSKFVNILYQTVYSAQNKFMKNSYGWLRVAYDSNGMYIQGQDDTEPKIYVNTATSDAQAVNGVIHQIDKFPSLPQLIFPDDEP